MKVVDTRRERREMRELPDCGKKYEGFQRFPSHCLRDCQEWIGNISAGTEIIVLAKSSK